MKVARVSNFKFPISVLILLLTLYSLLLPAPHRSGAWAWGHPFTLTNVSATVTYPSPASHTVAFTISSPQMTKEIRVRYCTTAWSSCTTPTGLSTTSAGKGSISGLTGANWNLNNSTNGLLILTNSSGETPSSAVSIQFTNIINPTTTGTFWFRISLHHSTPGNDGNEIEDGITASAKLSVTVSATVYATATVTFEGYGHPGDLVTFKDGASVIGTTNINSSGEFMKTFTGQPTGYHSYSLRAQNMATGRSTNQLTWMVNLQAGQTYTYSDILFSPTIGTSKSSYTQSENVKTVGATFPFSTVFIYYASPDPVVKQATSTSTGAWSHTLTDETLSIGSHTTYGYVQQNGGLTSEMSPIVPFTVTTTCKGDYNNDGWVNLTDFSILLYYWGKHDTTHDLSGDGYINLTDFSIMLFYWGKC